MLNLLIRLVDECATCDRQGHRIGNDTETGLVVPVDIRGRTNIYAQSFSGSRAGGVAFDHKGLRCTGRNGLVNRASADNSRRVVVIGLGIGYGTAQVVEVDGGIGRQLRSGYGQSRGA